jgi:mycofactocin precursor
MQEPTAAVEEPRAEEPVIDEESLIEEVSIDGMCGVY